MSDNIERLLGSIDERTQMIQKDVTDIYKKLDTVQDDTTVNTTSVGFLKKSVFGIFGIVGSIVVYLIIRIFP